MTTILLSAALIIVILYALFATYRYGKLLDELKNSQKDIDSIAADRVNNILGQLQYKNLIEANLKIEEFDKMLEENREYLKYVLNDVNKALEGNIAWGFDSNSPFPGSTSISVNYESNSEDSTIIVIRGKTEFEDSVKELVLNEPDHRRRFSIAVRSLQLQGIGNTIAKELLKSPAVTYTLKLETDEEGNEKLIILYQVFANLCENTFVVDL